MYVESVELLHTGVTEPNLALAMLLKNKFISGESYVLWDKPVKKLLQAAKQLHSFHSSACKISASYICTSLLLFQDSVQPWTKWFIDFSGIVPWARFFHLIFPSFYFQ